MLNLLITGNILMIVTFVLRLNALPPQIPLFYSRAIGENQLTDTWVIFLIPLILNLLYIINGFLFKKFFLGNDLIKKIFDYLNILLIVGFTFIFIRIILLMS